MGNSASSEPLVKIAKRPLARSLRKNNFSAYEHELRIAVEKQLRADAEWCGQLTEETSAILREFEATLAVKRCVIENCVWSVYAAALSKRKLDFVLLLDLVQRLCKAIGNKDLVDDEQLNVFWSAAANFTEAAVSTIRNSIGNTESALHPEQLSALFQCLKSLHTVAPHRSGLLWQRIVDAMTVGAKERWANIIGSESVNDENPMQNGIRVGQQILAEVNRLEKCHAEVSRDWPVSPFTIAYIYYDIKVSELVKPIVADVTRSLKSVRLSDDEMISLALEASGVPSGAENELNENEAKPDLTVGTTFFELYVSIQQFHRVATALPDLHRKQVKLAGFHNWFSKAVSHWLDIAVFKALMRIGKAVNLDNFQTVDNLVKYSSSAVDTAIVYYQIKTFWEQLSWPEAEVALPLALKILDDGSRCASFYVETIRLKLERLYFTSSDQPFTMSTNICAALNSIMHVRKSFTLLANDIGLPVLCDTLKVKTTFTHSQTVEALSDCAIDNINVKLDELLHSLAEQVKTELRKMLRVVIISDCNVKSMEKMKDYILSQLSTLNMNTDKHVVMHFFNIFHRFALQNLNELVQSEIKSKRQPAYFRKWEKLAEMIDKSFYLPDVNKENANEELLDKIRSLLKLHGADTTELIHQYRLERIKEAEKDEGLGSITVQAVFTDDILNIEVLNARNLNGLHKGGSADPYVKIQLLPSHNFPDAAIMKTKVQKNTLFPLFDESFTYSVPKAFHSSPECYVLLVVKDRGLIGFNDEFMGEAFLGFQQIERRHDNVKMAELQQTMLPLTKPSKEALEYLEVLEYRSWDKKARDFVKKERKRSVSNT